MHSLNYWCVVFIKVMSQIHGLKIRVSPAIGKTKPEQSSRLSGFVFPRASTDANDPDSETYYFIYLFRVYKSKYKMNLTPILFASPVKLHIKFICQKNILFAPLWEMFIFITYIGFSTCGKLNTSYVSWDATMTGR